MSPAAVFATEKTRQGSSSQGDEVCPSSTRKEPERGGRSRRGKGRQHLQGARVPGDVIPHCSVTMLEVSLDAPLLMFSKCFEKVANCWCVLKHQEHIS